MSARNSISGNLENNKTSGRQQHPQQQLSSSQASSFAPQANHSSSQAIANAHINPAFVQYMNSVHRPPIPRLSHDNQRRRPQHNSSANYRPYSSQPNQHSSSNYQRFPNQSSQTHLPSNGYPVLEVPRQSSSRDSQNDRRSEAENRPRASRGEEDSKANNKPRSDQPHEIFTKKVAWTRMMPAEPYYALGANGIVAATDKLCDLQQKFRTELVDRNSNNRATRAPYEYVCRKAKLHTHCHHGSNSSEESCCSSDEEDSDSDGNAAFEELQRKKAHPWRLHDELWYNDLGEMNDGPLCRCSLKSKKSGIRHGIYPGEDHMKACQPTANNSDKLYHYRLVIEPLTNYYSRFPTAIHYDSHEFIFEGFSLLSHSKLTNYPPCKLIRFNIEYTITVEETKFPVNFTVEDLELLRIYIFQEVLELIDINWHADGDVTGCPRFHLLPRFSRLIDDDGKELLSPAIILQYLLQSSQPVVSCEKEQNVKDLSDDQWATIAKAVKDMIVVYPGSKPSAIRVDQVDRIPGEGEGTEEQVPIVVHFGVRPSQLSYAGNPQYQKAWRDYVKFRHLLANKPKVAYADRQLLLQKEEKLQELRVKGDLKRDVTVEVNAEKCVKTGLRCDIVQHALMMPVLLCHLRFHQAISHLESTIGYQFKDRYLLQLALTHPSYRENFGTNPDHVRNALTNCGIRQRHYGDRRVHFMNTRKRGINMLINIMSKLGSSEETSSNINHNERLEFLGDAVVEFLSSIHLFFMFPDLEEGGLATYRAALVQNQHLALLAKRLHLERYMLYAHGSDLCHDLELRHAMANCFEALMGALFLDGGIDVADRVFCFALFGDNPGLLDIWVNYPRHPLQRQEPDGDRHYLAKVPRLQELQKFEELTGIEFTHIRLLARAFTHRSVGFNHLTLGSNQRMEFLGDTVLQLVASEYLYKFFPEHHEGHLSLLRSSLVNNKTQSVVCDDLAMTQFATYNYAKGDLKTKDRADLLEAFLGALYVDKGLVYCRKFCEVCFFPRLEHFILNQDWNDPKSKLQQCCLTLRSGEGGDPAIPIYKVVESLGPTNTRIYRVAVYFREKRLADGKGNSIQEAEMAAATNALKASKELFPQLKHQKRVMQRHSKNNR
ncbi:Ribonuclease 3 [Halotydeus destructor]|nr:Ribonuclease 3 [Halotydeus destructor]